MQAADGGQGLGPEQHGLLSRGIRHGEEGAGTPAQPAFSPCLQVSACFLSREMGYFSQYLAWVKEEVSRGLDPPALRHPPLGWASGSVLLLLLLSSFWSEPKLSS